jgi:DNA-binding beta-propeller fold protein YncE
MNRLRVLSGSSSLLGCVVGAAAFALAVSGVATGCGGGGNPGAGGAGGDTSSSGAQAGGGGSGGGTACKKNAGGPTRGAAIAVSPDDSRVVSVNRDAGTVTVMKATYGGSGPKLDNVAELKVGAEPWQVAIDGCGKRAYVVLRKEQKVVTIEDIDGNPRVGDSADVGSEPTSLALTPDNRDLYVANWVDGTLTVLDGFTLKEKGARVDLNGALAGAPAKYLGDVKSRPALAHPRSLAITADGKKVYATEFFGQRTRPESTGGTIDPNVDTTHEGVVYVVDTASGAAKTVPLAPLSVTGFKDHTGADTGCYPNQLQGISLNGNFAYVTAICASPKGPLGVFQKQACVVNADCASGSCNTAVGSCNGACNPVIGDTDCAANLDGATGVCVATGAVGACKGVTADVKATTHPVMFVIDTKADAEVVSDPNFANLNKGMWDLYGKAPASPDDASRRMPLVANEITFIPGTKVGYVSANGADAVFRFTYDDTGAVVSVGGDKGTEFINLAPATFDPANTASKGVGPIGLFAAHSENNKFLFTNNDITRNVSAIDLPSQKVAGGATPVVVPASPLPTDPASLSKIAGKKFFNTGLARWSLKGQAWGSCQNCHVDGLSDNVTWYFNRGIRQSVSLDGSFSKKNPDADQRIFNWTAIFDEVSDFENNTRGVSGGVGALVSAASMPPAAPDRINLNDSTAFGPNGANSLNGSTADIDENISVLTPPNWKAITDWIKTIRSPRAPSNLDPKKVAAGEAIFKDGNCKGCHSGDKWTISTLFYSPTNGGAAANPNAKLLATSWEGVVPAMNETFPPSMLPAPAGSRNMRTVGNPAFVPGSQKSLGFDQLLCILRPVGTFGVSPAEVGAIELRQDMVTPSQGAGTSQDGNGFNPPSLLNLQAGAPYFHGGNARTLEEAFDSDSATFAAHYDAIKTDQNFLLGSSDVENLVAYLLSIDGDKAPLAIPTLPATPPGSPTNILGGDYCSTTSTP